MDADPKSVHEMYKDREEAEQAFDAVKNELENDKAYMHTAEGIRGYFFISFISLYMHFIILETLREKVIYISDINTANKGGEESLQKYPINQNYCIDFRIQSYSPKSYEIKGET
ncbi:MAG: hypothetical protein QXQ46_04510 [Thermoplasmatales archaeon]